ncbi:Tumor necrosis factor receptor superfamily member 10A [Stylophora pistillata]|uniref:Tumor necrosis factor receptor superfamily member 10A n=1 Tax=Stylophora pistillata TaxID=50429 RepID=A0A2B4S776_STYPI|nr:Tumor necrosis factor receptor superfamily member 10A [Stylophora pistillata]
MDCSMNNNTLDPNVGMTESIIHEYQLPKLIGPEKWRDLARMLDFSQNDIDAIQAEKISCPKECCIAVLVKWIHRKGREATVGKLADALIKIELKSVADKLKAPVNDRRTLTFEVGGTIKVDDENQIILGYDRTETSTFFVWETKRKEFNTSLKEIKDYINAIGQITGNTPN